MPLESQHGLALLRDPLLNKGTAFTEVERDALGLRGLLPPHVQTQEEQVARFLANMRRLPNPLDKFIALSGLHDRNEGLFFRVVCDNLDEIMPLIYTPTVGLACQRFGHIFQRHRGLFLSINDVVQALPREPEGARRRVDCFADHQRMARAAQSRTPRSWAEPADRGQPRPAPRRP